MSSKLACINKYGKRKRFQRQLSKYKKSYVRTVFDVKIKNITIDIFKIIPHICYRQRKITAGLDSDHLGIFLKVQIQLRELSYLVLSLKFNSDKFFFFAFFEFFRNIVEKLIYWLSTTDENIVLVIINSFPIIINIIENIKKKNIRSRKKCRFMNTFDYMYIEKLTKRFIQILSLFSTSIHVGTRVSCVFNMNSLTKADSFDMRMLDEAFLPQNSQFEYVNTPVNNPGTVGDTTATVSQGLTTKFSEFKKSVVFSSKFSLVKFFKITSIKGVESEIYDKGWLYKRLDDESPAVRFEVFIMINDIFKSKKLSMSDSFMNKINDIVFDYFLDENIAIQTLISEMIITISRNIPISTENISKITPTINDCNINTKNNLFRIAAFGVFLDSEGLIKLITTLVDSTELLDEISFYNIIPFIVKNNLNIANEIINGLFDRYFEKEGFRRGLLLIFAYWTILKSPSVINKISPKLLLLYPIAKLYFFQFIPEIRSSLFDIEPPSIETREHVYWMPQNKFELNRQDGQCHKFSEPGITLKAREIKALTNYDNQKTLMEAILLDYEPMKYIFNYSNTNLISKHYFRKSKKVLLTVLDIIESSKKLVYRNSFRINVLSRINNVLLALLPSTNINLIGFLLEGTNISELFSFRNYGLISDQKLCQIYCNSIYGLSKKSRYKIIFSCFFISVPFITYSTRRNNEELITYPKNKNCLSILNKEERLKNFWNLFCNCMFCKNYLINCKSTFKHSKLPEIISSNRGEENHARTLVFPFRVIREIPININFNVCDIEKKRLKSIKLLNSTVNVFIQIPRILRFSLLSDESRDFCIKKDYSTGEYSNILEELNSMNFFSRKPVEIHSNSAFRISKFSARSNLENEAIEIMSSELKFNTRDVRISSLYKEVKRITVRYSIPIIYDHPLASPVPIFASIKNYKFGCMNVASNICSLEIHPDDMKWN
ncbi:hypothetical protein RS030_7997 [Cryptosporidium xiaoi]|uniref:Uncharacterized protein n=1 Tax=Cryptosporidium xiaoi TaxID=659607 RepID=A0AAV9XUL3_9CRYT